MITVLALLGVNWTSYTNANGVWDIVERDDTFYLATTGGLVVFDPATETVIRQFTNLDGLPSVVLSGVALDAAGRPWVLCTGEGLAYFDGTSFQRYSSFILPISNPDNIRYANGIWSRGNWIFIATNEGLLVIDNKGTPDTTGDGRALLDSEFFGSDTVNSVYFYGDSMFVCSDSGGGVLRAQVDEFLFPSSWDTVYPYRPSYCVLREDTLVFVGTNKGLRLGDDFPVGPSDMKVTALAGWNDLVFFNTDTNGVWLLGQDTLFSVADSIRCLSLRKNATTLWRKTKCPKGLYAGAQGVWVGFGWPLDGSPEPQYYTGGFARYVPSWHFVGLSELGFGLVSSMVNRADGSVWLGVVQPGEYPVAVMKYANGGWDSVRTVYNVYAMRAIGQRLFLGWWLSGLYELDANGKVILHYGQDEGLSPPNISAMGEDLSGNLLMGVMSGDGKAYRLLGTTLEYLPGVYLGSEPQAISMTPDGALWMGSLSGIYTFVKQGATWSQSGVINSAGGLPDDNITLIERHMGVMWIGTSKGLARWDDGQLTTVLPDKSVNSVAFEADGNIWAWTGDGLYRMTDEGVVLERYIPGSCGLVGDGLPAGEKKIKQALVLVPERDELWIGTDKGVSVLSDIGTREGWREGAHIYPNPLYIRKGYSFRIGEGLAGSGVTVYTLDGKQVVSCTLGTDPVVTLPQTIAPGLYLVLVKYEGETTVLKLVVE